jgi:DNA-binding NtrC family response regulator
MAFTFLALRLRSQFLMTETLANKAILIIDDDARMLKALERVLSQEGAAVTCAELAMDAFKILATRPGEFNLIITDLRMPFVRGERVVRIIHEILPQLPVIVLTAFGGPEIEAECAHQGAVAFLEKPLDASRLLEVVGKIFTANKGEAAKGISQNGSGDCQIGRK